MDKQRVTRTPLIAVLGFLAFFAVPAAAQAHHVNTEAKCVLENNVPTVEFTAYFVGFSSTHNVTGKVNVDNVKRFPATANPEFGSVPVQWGYKPNTPNDGRWTFKYQTSPGTHTVQGDFKWSGEGADDDKEIKHTTNACPAPKTPGISVEKDGPATAYVGSQATFTYKVTNTGNVVLTELDVTDDKCAPLTKVTQQNQFDPGDVWDYTCTVTITDAMGDELINTVTACGEYGNQKVCDEDDHKTKIPKPAIALEKTGAATAAAGDTFTYSFKATNTGNVTLTNVVLTDDKCQSTLTRVEPNLADATFDEGDQWYFTCTVVAPAGPAQVDNIANVCGDYDDA